MFGLFNKHLKFSIACPVCGFGFQFEITKQEFDHVTLQGGVAILDESTCPFCKHNFYTLTTDKVTITTQERDWIQKIEQLEDRLQVINEVIDEEHNKVDGDAQRKAQLRLHAETTQKRITELEAEFEAHCAQWQKRRVDSQL